MRQLADPIEQPLIGELTFLVSEHGRPLTKESFGNLFRDRCIAAGVNRSAHGLRKLAATDMAEKGGTELQLQAAFGWTTNRQSATYTRNANRKRLALEDMAKRDGNNLFPNLRKG